MNKFLSLKELSTNQADQYNQAKAKAFPPVINESQTIKAYWDRMETYFPEYQHFLIGSEDELIGFINMIPFHFGQPLSELPDRGWDWMLEKSIYDYESKVAPNYLGALQVIVRKNYQNQGYSKKILSQAKQFMRDSKFQNLIIPIRPTLKHLHPTVPMEEYLKLKDDERAYDPWVRTHINGGAQIIKVCNQSMTVEGDLRMWKRILGHKVVESGEYILKGALRPIVIDIENDTGQYLEPNVWVKYD